MCKCAAFGYFDACGVFVVECIFLSMCMPCMCLCVYFVCVYVYASYVFMCAVIVYLFLHADLGF